MSIASAIVFVLRPYVHSVSLVPLGPNQQTIRSQKSWRHAAFVVPDVLKKSCDLLVSQGNVFYVAGMALALLLESSYGIATPSQHLRTSLF